MSKTSITSGIMALGILLGMTSSGASEQKNQKNTQRHTQQTSQQRRPQPSPNGGTAAPAASYRVFAYNNLGMHCYDSDFSVFSILPPFNVIQAQVVRRGAPPKLCTSSDVTCSYLGTADASGSINTTSVGKTDFFQYCQSLYGAKLLPDEGILGADMPGPANTPQAMIYVSAQKWFLADGIPITDLDNAMKFNPYPLMRIKSVPRGTTSGAASIDIVAPVSSEMGCAACHATGRAAASRPGIAFSHNTDIDLQYRENVLLLHDALHNTTLFQTKPVLCASCHYSKALDLAGVGPTPTQQKHDQASIAVHRRHGLTLSGGLPDASHPALIPDNGATSCYNCHPGTITNCLRGVMSSAAIQCQNCHGGLLQVGGEFAPTRQPWADVPKCQSCHNGDAVNSLTSALPATVAFSDALTAAPLLASNKRFAENDGQLYRNSLGHSGLACGSCHGSPHAEWPAHDPNANDNVAAKQLQGHAGTILECNVCHSTSPSANLEGPHGMHPVNDPNWISAHHDIVEHSGDAACKPCHGRDLKGTRLSKTPVARTLRGDDRTVAVAAGTKIGCTLCHEYPPR